MRHTRQENRAEHRARDRARGYRVYDEHKARARKILHNALRRGEITRQPCEVCGERSTDGHHDDHTRPLSVRWLCRKHHGEVHQRINPAGSHA